MLILHLPHPQANQIFSLLKEQGIQQKASEVLEGLIEKLISGEGSTMQAVEFLKSQGITLSPSKSGALLEKLIVQYFSYSHTQINQLFDLLREQGAQLTPEKASELLVGLIENLVKVNRPQADSMPDGFGMKLVKFLQGQAGTISPVHALAILEKSERPLPPTLKEIILGPIQQDVTPIDSPRATTLLQQAVGKKQGPEMYKLLLKKGADPNIMVKNERNENVPLLHYIAENNFKPSYKELFEELISSPTTNINIRGTSGFTLAMAEANNWHQHPEIVEALLARNDLDINSIHATSGNTLLDIIVENCMQVPYGSDGQIEAKVQANMKWLNVLKKASIRPIVVISAENINKAQKYSQQLIEYYKSTYRNKKFDNPIRDTVREALQVIGAPIPAYLS